LQKETDVGFKMTVFTETHTHTSALNMLVIQQTLAFALVQNACSLEANCQPDFARRFCSPAGIPKEG